MLWEQKPDGDKMHARYVMTERGGISIDGGLDLGDESETTDVGLMARSVYQQRWKDFQRNATTYTFVEAIEIEGR
jgi:hypothetical protein